VILFSFVLIGAATIAAFWLETREARKKREHDQWVQRWLQRNRSR